ncbi:hypothetical protein [Endozoicomonas sp. 8E]|uniref:hypothetical protein n=1 Tax=Endozoicomonas sp. 8E TaxID=3035692 RepID=UPI0029391FBD|nr:hypothetical protein [Endozoicomonas sp. 8E]WOG29437.1 hypothetical protein P6910_07250 [Endozoicomonas sp. 8E]
MYSCMTTKSPDTATGSTLQFALNAFSGGKEQAKDWLYNGGSRVVSILYSGVSAVGSMAKDSMANMRDLYENGMFFEWDWDETDLGDRQAAVADTTSYIKEPSSKEQPLKERSTKAPSRIPRPVGQLKKNPDHAFMTALAKPHPIPLNTPGAEVAERYQKNIRTVVFGDKNERKPKAQQKALSADFLARQNALVEARKKYENNLKAPVAKGKSGKVNPETTRRLAQPKYTRTKGEKKAIRDFTQEEFTNHAFPKLYLRQDFEKNRPLEAQSRQK